MTAEIVKLVKKPDSPTAPKALSKPARAEWMRLAPLLKAKGTLTAENEPLLTAYVNAMCLVAECDRELGKGKLLIKGTGGTLRPHPLLGARNKASQNALQLAKRLGIIGDGTAPPAARGPDAWSKMDL